MNNDTCPKMTLPQALTIALEAMRKERQRLAVQANLCLNFGLASAAPALRRYMQLSKAMLIITEFLNQQTTTKT